MSKRGDIEFLDDISEAIRRLEFYTQKMDYEDFLEKSIKRFSGSIWLE